jgi:hypothetical protein
MLNQLRREPAWGARMKGILAAVLLTGSGAAMADVSYALCAQAGVPAAPSPLAGAVTKVYGYAADCSTAVTRPGGPVLTATVGELVTVTLTNNLPVASGLLFQGQPLPPDTTGAAAGGGTRTYTFTASAPGTYLYEAAPLLNAEHQPAMGLHGALIVRPATAGQAYADPLTAYDQEAVLVLSEIDPVLANSADPTTFDMRNYAPQFFLINGKPYPTTDTIPATGAAGAGQKVLLRYVNAGAKHHSMALLGLRQMFVAKDGSTLPSIGHDVAAETLAPGQTGDAIVTIPASVTTAQRYAVYDGNLHLRNSNAAGFGGMLTFLNAGAGAAAGGPTASNVTVAPNPSNGGAAVTLSASLAATAPATVNLAEYFIDATGADGAGTAMTGTTSATATVSTAVLATLASGSHTFFVHGRDSTGAWGAFSTAILNLDKAGPAVSALSLTPNPSSGTTAVVLAGTGSEVASGGSKVTAAEYFIGAAPGPNVRGTAMNVNVAATVASLTATLPCSQAVPCAAATYNVRAMDEVGNWGPFAGIAMNVFAPPPTTSNVGVAKTPNNGTIPLSPTQPVVRVTATMASVGSTIAGAEAFIDTLPNNTVRGIPLVPGDGVFNAATETGYADIPLTTVAGMTNGSHTIYVRGQDAAGNWGAAGPAATLVVDKQAPTISAATLSASTIPRGTASVTLNVTSADSGTGVTGAQYWIDGSATPPANATAFTGASVSINTAALPIGVHTVYVRVQDGATNWSAVSSATLRVAPIAVADTKTITASGAASQNQDYNSNTTSLLANDQPNAQGGGTATLVSAPVRTSGTGSGTIALSCPFAGSSAGPAVGGSQICTNGRFRVTLTGVGATNAARAQSKRGTFTFTYTDTFNGVASAPVTVTINVQ